MSSSIISNRGGTLISNGYDTQGLQNITAGATVSILTDSEMQVKELTATAGSAALSTTPFGTNPALFQDGKIIALVNVHATSTITMGANDIQYGFLSAEPINLAKGDHYQVMYNATMERFVPLLAPGGGAGTPIPVGVENILSLDVTANADIADLTFTGLTIGAKYSLKGQIVLDSNDGFINGVQFMGGSSLTGTTHGRVELFNETVGDSTLVTSGVSLEFTADSTTLYTNKDTADKTVFGDGTKGRTFLQLREIPQLAGGGGAGGTTSQTMAGTAIDMSYDTQDLTISSDTTLTVVNPTAGSKTVLTVNNTDASPHSLGFLGIGISPTDSAAGVSAGAYTIYQLETNLTGTFVQVLASDSSAPFPAGSDGDLTILNGQNVNLNAGDIKDYNNIDIQLGGTLTLLDPSNTGALVEVYCSGTFVIDGEITGRDTLNNGAAYSGNIALGTAYNFTQSQSTGGGGGTGQRPHPTLADAGGAGGAGTNGFGGGGGGGGTFAGVGAGAGGSNGGAGGNGTNGYGHTAGTGGAGNSTLGNGSTGGTGIPGQSSGCLGQNSPGDGGNGGGSGGGGGSVGDDSFCFWYAGCGGGGGGQKGSHGANLFLYSVNTINGSGSINLSGRSGYLGGAGGGGAQGGGGGGGGGAGGSGGNILYTAPSITVASDLTGGAGGSGGAVGSGGTGGSSGATGIAGSAGSVQNI